MMAFNKLNTLMLLVSVVFADSNLFLSEETDLNDIAHLGDVDINEAPVIGILSQSTPDVPLYKGYTSYMMSAYVKFIEGQGARVIPIIFGEPEEVTNDKLSKVNGVLFPGGGGDYIDLGRKILKFAIEQNDNGKHFPVWGTCLGFERLANFTSEAGSKILDHFGSKHQSLPIHFKVDPSQTKMFNIFGSLAEELASHNLTFNAHQYSIKPETFKNDKGLASFWDVTSTSTNDDGQEFVTTIESKKYPIFATQFHPEKVSQIFIANFGINHSFMSLLVNEMFAKKLIMEARQSTQSFGNFSDYQKYDISNYNKLWTKSMEDIYVFK